MRLLRLALVGEATGSGLAADLDLTGLVETADEAKSDSGQPETVSEFTVLLDVLELVETGTIDLRVEDNKKKRERGQVRLVATLRMKS